ncbi:recombinase family protein [Streptomyces sp. NPDC048504]|uniref:recombinase family protein n=1 Tax=Streptomyces sp. NPDC048504 TaxID=3365559 RepID=UPI00371C055C
MSTIQAPPVPITIALQRVADYARLSEDDAKDPDLRGENVGIQLDECAVFRTTRPDWTLVGSFKDNDISASAYGNEVREDFERLMNLVRTNGVDVILCVEVTRLFRKPLEAEVLIDLVWSKKTTFHTVVTTRGGYYDLRTSAGRKAVRDAVNAAAGESDNISDRVRMKKAALARRGMPNGGRRAYGFEKNGIDHRASDVEVMHEMAERIIKGESVLSIMADLDERGIKTAEGGRWTKATIVNMLRRVRYAPFDESGKGIREHNGVHYKAVWDAVFDAVTWEKLQAALNGDDQLREQRGNPRKYLLRGFVFCGACGSLLGGSMKRDRPSQPNKPRYKCKPYDAYGKRTGCSGVSRLAEPMEDFISEAVLFRLDSPEFAAIFAENEEDSAKLKAALDTQQLKKQKLDELIDGYYGDNPDDLSRDQFMRAKASGEVALKNAEREVEKYSTKRAVVGIPIGQTIREAWEHNTDIGWRRKIVGLLIDKVIVHPGGGKPRYKQWRFDIEMIEIQWKV